MTSRKIAGWLRPRAACDYLSIGKRTLAAWMKTGKIPHSKVDGIVLLERAELDRYLRSRAVESKSDAIAEQMVGKR